MKSKEGPWALIKEGSGRKFKKRKPKNSEMDVET